MYGYSVLMRYVNEEKATTTGTVCLPFEYVSSANHMTIKQLLLNSPFPEVPHKELSC